MFSPGNKQSEFWEYNTDRKEDILTGAHHFSPSWLKLTVFNAGLFLIVVKESLEEDPAEEKRILCHTACLLFHAVIAPEIAVTGANAIIS